MIDFETFKAAGGEIIGGKHESLRLNRAAVDSRKAEAGDLFIALKGERTDGHLYIRQALENGAAAVLMTRKFYESNKETAAMLRENTGIAVQLVDDSLRGLQRMARYKVGHFPRRVLKIGVTGSNGKTTTKELIGAVAMQKGSAFINEGNLNSDIGLCQEVLRCDGEEPIAVFEMGMNRAGEMDQLAEILRPDIGVITNIGTAHIGILGSKESIAGEKKKIFSRFHGEEAGFVHEDEPFFDFLRQDVDGEILPYGARTEAAEELDLGLEGSKISFHEGTIRFPLIGGYNRKNMYAAVAVGRYLGMPFSDMREALEGVEPLFGRGQIIRGDVTVILDCYNANDDSMREVLSLAAGLPWEGAKIAVLGDLKELGEYGPEIHGEMGEFAAGQSFDVLFFYGELMRYAYERAVESGGGNAGQRFFHFEKMDKLSAAVERWVKPGDLLLLKGSRSIELEQVYYHLTGGTAEGVM